MNCSVDGREPMEFVRSRKCLYDVDAGRYSIIGDALDCGGEVYSLLNTKQGIYKF